MTVEAKIRIEPQMQAALNALRAVRKEVVGLGGAAQQADSVPVFTKTRKGLDSISQQLQSVRQQVLALFGLQQATQGIAALSRMSDEYTGINARLRIATQGQQEFNDALREARGLAQQYNQPLRETAALLTRSISALKPLGGGVREAAVATESLLASLKITGASTAESSSAILQFSQALGAGVLLGEEFNAINEAAPRLLDALAAGLGKPRGELKALAEQGQLTTNAVVTALVNELPRLKREAASIPPTIGGAYQALRDGLTQYIGKQLEANGMARLAATALKELAANIGAVISGLLSIVGIGLSLWLGRAVAGLTAAAGAAGVAAGGVGVLTVALRGLWVLIGGPVGLVVALASLAAAWLGVAKAKDAASKRTESQVRTELADVQAELALAREAGRKAGAGIAPQLANEITLLDARRKRLQREADEFDGQRNGAFRSDRNDGVAALGDPASVKRFEDAYATRARVAQRFADENAIYAKAKDIEISQARSRGDLSSVKKLEDEKAVFLREARQKQTKELRDLDAQNVLTRLASAKTLYDGDVALALDAAEREEKALQERFERGLVDLQTFLAEKRRLQDAQANSEIDKLRKQLGEEQRVRQANAARPAKDANAREAQKEADQASAQKIAQLTDEIVIKERERLDNARQLTREAERLTDELRKQQRQAQEETRRILGTETPEQRRARIREQFGPQLERERQLGGDGSATKGLIDATVGQGDFADAQNNLRRTQRGVDTQIADIRRQEGAGAIDAYEAERRIFALRKSSLPQLSEEVAQIVALSKSFGDDSPQAQAARDAEDLIKNLDALKSPLERLQQQTRQTAEQGFGTMFSDILSGSKAVGEALRGLLASFAKQMTDLIAQRLGKKLFESFGLGGFIDSGVSLITSLFGFHSGGVVRPGGQTFTRQIPAGLAMAAGQFAPRYHSGGIAGFKPNEQLAVLEEGEEVLTADNPRHINNMRSRGGVSVENKFVINGASGDASQKQTALDDLSGQMEAVVDQWALKHQRPGGILFRGRG